MVLDFFFPSRGDLSGKPFESGVGEEREDLFPGKPSQWEAIHLRGGGAFSVAGRPGKYEGKDLCGMPIFSRFDTIFSRTINSWVHKIRLHGRRGKGTAKSFSR